MTEELRMTLGPRVLGDEEFQRQQREHEEAAKRAFVYGPRVAGPTTEDTPVAATAPTTTATQEKADDGQSAETLSLAKLNDALQSEVTDELLDGLLAAEMEREGEPRKGALRLLLRAEQARGDAARLAIVAELQASLKG